MDSQKGSAKAESGNHNRPANAYRINFQPASRKTWEQNFHVLSLERGEYPRFISPEDAKSLQISGIALPVKGSVKAVEMKASNTERTVLASINEASPDTGQEYPEIDNSGSAEWSCTLGIKPDTDVVSYSFKAILDTGEEYKIGKIVLNRKPKHDPNKKNQPLFKNLMSVFSSRSIALKNFAQGRQYLFVIGNPRSGTTALGVLLQSSPDILLGHERTHLKNITPHIFEKETFFEEHSGRLIKEGMDYEDLRRKYDQVKYIGDKRPAFIKTWRLTRLHIPKMKIVYIFRHIDGVAASYNSRAYRTKNAWRNDRDFTAAVDEWNFEMKDVQNLRKRADVYFVKYEEVYKSKETMEQIFEYLKVDSRNPDVQGAISRTLKQSAELESKPRDMPDEQIRYIRDHADMTAYNTVLDLYEKQQRDLWT